MRITKLFGLLVFIALLPALAIGQDDYYKTKPDSIAKITTVKGATYTGTIVSDDGKVVTLESFEVGKIIIEKINIRQIKYISSPDPSNAVANLPLYEYGLGQTAFNLPRKQISVQNHYYAYWLFEYGITDNLSMDIGFTYPLLIPVKFGLKASVPLATDLRVGLKSNAFVTIDYGGRNSNITSTVVLPLNIGYNFTGMVTVGDPSINLSVGATYYNFNLGYLSGNLSGYGAYIGGHKKFKNKLGLSMELLYLYDNTETTLYSFGILCKYFRTTNKVYTIGLETPTFPQNNAFSTGSATQYLVIPFPYIGFRKLF
jgi:hypothetical protein